MEQLLAYQPWDLCMGFTDAAAAEKLSQHLLSVYKDEGVTVQNAFDLGITPLRPSEAPDYHPEGGASRGTREVQVAHHDRRVVR